MDIESARIDHSESSPKRIVEQAGEAVERGDLEAAEAILNNGKLIWPRSSLILLRLAEIRLMLGDPAGAASALQWIPPEAADPGHDVLIRIGIAVGLGERRKALDLMLGGGLPSRSRAKVFSMLLRDAIANWDTSDGSRPDDGDIGILEQVLSFGAINRRLAGIVVEANRKGLDFLVAAAKRHTQNTDVTIFVAYCLMLAGRPNAGQRLIAANPEIMADRRMLLSLPSDLVPPAAHRDLEPFALHLSEDAALDTISSAVAYLLVRKRIVDADALVQRMMRTPRGSRVIGSGFRALAAKPLATRRPLVREGELTIAHTPGDRAALIFFSGLIARMEVSGLLLDTYLPDLGLSLIAISDPDRLAYVGGVKSLGPDKAAALAAIRSVLKRLGLSRVVTLGASAGGFAAIDYGLDLGAEKAVCLSATTCLTADFMASDERGKIFVKRLAERFTDDQLDLRTRLSKSEARMPIDLYYGSEHVQDRRHALLLQDFAGVRLHALPGVEEHLTLHAGPPSKRLGEFLIKHFSKPDSQETAADL